MNEISITFFVGTRPEVIKLEALLKEAQSRNIDFEFIHTGQHYDWDMSTQYIAGLNLPAPYMFLNQLGSVEASNTGRIFIDTTEYLIKNKPKAVIVVGDTNSTLGVALAACKLNIPLVHIEAGCRSFDWAMPEEKNRVIVSDCADINFAPTDRCARNLRAESIRGEIIMSGHPIVKTVHTQIKYIDEHEILDKCGLQSQSYFLVTFHRVENVDYAPRLYNIIRALRSINMKIIFPMHPRTSRRLKEFGLMGEVMTMENIIITPPLPYSETLGLVKSASFVVTDSGGLQQEAFILGTPCITVRKSIPWRELAEVGATIHLDPSEKGFVEFFKATDSAYQVVKAKLRNVGQIFGTDDVPKDITDTLCSILDL